MFCVCLRLEGRLGIAINYSPAFLLNLLALAIHPHHHFQTSTPSSLQGTAAFGRGSRFSQDKQAKIALSDGDGSPMGGTRQRYNCAFRREFLQ